MFMFVQVSTWMEQLMIHFSFRVIKEEIPKLNIPPSYNKTKSMVKNLGLDYYKKLMHAQMIACCSRMIIRMTNFVILVELHDIFKLLKLIVSFSLQKNNIEFVQRL